MTSMKKKSEFEYAFFGTGEIAARVLKNLLAAQLVPTLIITSPDQPQGRGLAQRPSAVAQIAHAESLDTIKPAAFDSDLITLLQAKEYTVFVVADYGVLLPQKLLDLPKRGVINMHPSLLPRLRGPSPIRSAILSDEKETGVSVMLLDEKMDHGTILAQQKVPIPQWPPNGQELDEILARAGGMLLARILPLYVRGEIEPRAQNHDLSTYCKQFTKADGLINLAADAYQNLLKIRAFEGWPGTYTFFERAGKRIRVQILDAHIEHKKLVVGTVKPEGKKEMLYSEFMRSGAKPCA